MLGRRQRDVAGQRGVAGVAVAGQRAHGQAGQRAAGFHQGLEVFRVVFLGDLVGLEVGLQHGHELFVEGAGQGAGGDVALGDGALYGAGQSVQGGFLPAAFFPLLLLGKVANGVSGDLPYQLGGTGVVAVGLQCLLQLAGVLQGEIVGECAMGGGGVPAGECGGGGLAQGVGGGISRAGEFDLALDEGQGLAAIAAVLVATGEQAAGIAQGVGLGVAGQGAGEAGA